MKKAGCTLLVCLAALASSALAQDTMDTLVQNGDGSLAVVTLSDALVVDKGDTSPLAPGAAVLPDAVLSRDSEKVPVVQDTNTGAASRTSMDDLNRVFNVMGALSDSETASPGEAPTVASELVGARGNSEEPTFEGVELAMAPSSGVGSQRVARPTFRVLASAEGLIGARTASGKIIRSYTEGVALPHPKVLFRKTDITYLSNGRSVSKVPVLDVGPWNTNDAYWEKPGGRPQAATGRDRHRRRTNQAGIDIFNGSWYKLLGLRTYDRNIIENTLATVDWSFAD